MILLVEEVLHLRYIHPDIERRCALTWGMMWKQSELQKIRKKSWGIWMFPKIVGFPPKSSILIGFSTINHPFWDTPIFGSTHIVNFIFFLIFLPYNSSPFSKETMDLFSKIRKSINSPERTNSLDSTTPKGWWNFRDISTGAKWENDP